MDPYIHKSKYSNAVFKNTRGGLPPFAIPSALAPETYQSRLVKKSP